METVGAMLVRDGRVLLGKRASHKSYPNAWDIIGGHVETGETCWVALCRELHEELGITDVEGECVATLQTGETHHLVSLKVYHVSSWEGVPEVKNDEHSEVRWFDKEGIDRITDLVSDEYRPIISRLIS